MATFVIVERDLYVKVVFNYKNHKFITKYTINTNNKHMSLFEG